MFCEYRDMFGAPGTGVHRFRFLDVAIVDVLAVLLMAWIVCKYVLLRFTVSTYCCVAGAMFLTGVIAHRIFCVRTTVDKFLFHQ